MSESDGVRYFELTCLKCFFLVEFLATWILIALMGKSVVPSLMASECGNTLLLKVEVIARPLDIKTSCRWQNVKKQQSLLTCMTLQ